LGSSAVETVLESHREGLAVADGAVASEGYRSPTLAGRRRERSLRRLAKKAAERAKTWLKLGRGGVGAGQAQQAPEQLGEGALREAFERSVGYGGVAFGSSGVSLSHEQLLADSARIQELFDAGHTVLKTVISFDHDYLVEQGIVLDETVPRDSQGNVRRGGYRGQVDQLKMRLAVMEGVNHMARVGGFDDLLSVMVLQVDTGHLHAHLAMVDAGRGRLAADGSQKGKLSAKEIALLRKGIDSSLDRSRTVAHLSSSVHQQRRNVSAYIRGWAHRSLGVSAQAQFVLACLPGDRRMWRASTNRKEMDKANRLVRALVEETLSKPGSPLPAALSQVEAYALERMTREGLSTQSYEGLIADGRERIIRQAMNGVYAVLAAVADDELSVRTDMLSSMSVDFEELVASLAPAGQAPSAATDASAGQFALRLRAYSERSERHRELRRDYLLRARAWESAKEAGRAAPGSEAMFEHYLVEADYHGRCLSKYQHYLDLSMAEMNEWPKQWREVEDYGRRLAGLRALRNDKSLPKMKEPSAAEALGRELYGQHGGALLAAIGAEGRAGRAVIDDRLERMQTRYDRMVSDLLESWRQVGPAVAIRFAEPGAEPEQGERVVSEGDAGSWEQSAGVEGSTGSAVLVRAAPQHGFEEVKGLDMHELGLDWSTDQAVGRRTLGRFTAMAHRREDAAVAAQAWMIETGQGELVEPELGDALGDVARMVATASSISETGVLGSRLAQAAQQARQRRARRAVELAAEQERAANEALDELLAEAVSRDELEALILAEAAEHGRDKAVGTTVALDTGVGGAVTASVTQVVRSFDARGMLED